MDSKKRFEAFIKSYIKNAIARGEISSVGEYAKAGARNSSQEDYIRRMIEREATLMRQKVSAAGSVTGGYADYLDSLIGEIGAGADAAVGSVAADAAPATGYDEYLKRYRARASDEYGRMIEKEEAERKATAKAERDAAEKRLKEQEKKKADAAKKKADAAAEKKKLEEAAAAERQKREAAYKKSLEKAESRIRTQKLMTVDEAKALALEYGVSEEDAARIAERTVTEVKREKREKAVSAILQKKMTHTQAYAYAIALGFSAEEATELSEVAKQINQTVPSGEDIYGYLDRLEEDRKNGK